MRLRTRRLEDKRQATRYCHGLQLLLGAEPVGVHRRLEGLIVATARLQHPLLDRLQAEGVRMVLINRRTTNGDIPSVTADDATGIATAVAHLADMGHRHIAHLAGPQNTSTGVVRHRAFLQALRDHGLEDDPGLVAACASWSEDEGARALRGLLDTACEFTAVIAGNDLLALGCYDVFAERGIDCPGDLSVVGFNDMPFIDKLRLLPLTLIRRQSTGPPARILA